MEGNRWSLKEVQGCLFPLVSLALLFKLKPLYYNVIYIPDAPDEMTRLVMKARA